ncbi:MAG: hypothetical protein ACLFR2_06755, partial [Candidatus Kapaibacterium sp.]
MKKILPFLIVLIIFGCDEDNPANVRQAKQIELSEFTESSIHTELNKFEIAPLTVNISVWGKIDAMLELRVIDDMDKRVQKESVIADDTTEFTFLGLFPGKENFIELKFIRGNGDYALDTVSVTTDPLPEFMPDVSIVTPGSDNIEPGWNLCNFSIRENNTHHSYPYAFDKYGNVR